MRYAKIERNSIANGTGVRVVLWCQGCSMHCKGCHNEQTWDFSGGFEFDEQAKKLIYKELRKRWVAGITISGGHPLEPENADECLSLIKEIRTKFPKKTVWLYTGRTLDNVFEDTHNPIYQIYREIVSLCDVVVDGCYIEDERNIGLKWRGSSNQRVIDVKKTLLEGRVIEIED